MSPGQGVWRLLASGIDMKVNECAIEMVPMLTLSSWFKAGRECRAPVQDVFKELGLEPDLANLYRASVNPLQLIQALALCTDRAQKGYFPLVLGEMFAFEHLPEIETYLATCTSLRNAMCVLDWVRQLINPWMQVELRESGHTAVLSLQTRLVDCRLPPVRHVIEATLLGIKHISQNLLGGAGSLKELWLAHEPTDTTDSGIGRWHADYTRHFGVSPRYGRERYAIVFDRAYLDMPLPGASQGFNHQARSLVQARLARQVEDQNRSRTLQGAIEQLLCAKPELMRYGVRGVAQELGFSGRTLQRMLQREGLTMSSIQQKVRFQLAGLWLRNKEADIERISERLGFSDRRSFTLAFKRWSGMTPGVFRRMEGPIDLTYLADDQGRPSPH